MAVLAQDADPVRLLRDMVAIDSVNLSAAHSDRIKPERKMVAFLEQYLKRLGFTTKRVPVRAGRCNLVARLKGRDPRKVLMLEGHMDTVGVEGMSVDPFRLTRNGDRLYGRGTADTKGPVASYLAGLARALRDGVQPAWGMWFVGCMGEESGCEGSLALARNGFKAHVGLVAEPTHLQLCVTHKSSLWWKVRVRGRTAHGSNPHLGVNAIEGAACAVQALARHGNRLAARKSHGLMTPATLSIGTIQGGEKTNVVPDHAEFTVDSRLLPGEKAVAYIGRAERMLRSLKAGNGRKIDARVVEWKEFSGFCSDPRAQFPVTLSQVCREVVGRSVGNPVGASYFSDAGPLAKCVPQLVVFGPGDIAQAHTSDEYIEARQLEAGTEIIRRLITVWG